MRVDVVTNGATLGAWTIFLFVCSCGAAAQPAVTPIDATAVATFADEFFPGEMARRNIPGLVFVFVSGDEIAIARGYGAAALEPRRPVDPALTRFRLASVSKAITATAALTLVEDGRLDLHRDVTTYLRDLRFVDQHGAITLHHLLTHTAGFEERLIDTAARAPADLRPLADYLARSMPSIFVEPGRVTSYSNHGLGLVGLLVQQASGRPFAEYVREEVFTPLGMSRSDALLGPVPDDMAVAYDVVSGRPEPLSPEYLQITPAGAFYTTGLDMGRLLIAHLRGGSYQGHQVLRPDTVALMQAQHFAQHPGMPGWAYGLWEDTRDGHRALLHNGGGKGYRALMYLLPSQNCGFFVAYNLADRHEDGELQEVFITRFRSTFLPPSHSDASPVPAAVESTDRFRGEYVYVRRARSTIESFISIFSRVRVETCANGALNVSGSCDAPIELIPIGPLLFRRADGRGMIAFEPASADHVQRVVMTVDSGFPAVYERVPFIDSLRVQAGWLLGMALVFLYAAVWRPLAEWRQQRAHIPLARRWSTRLGSLASALNLVFVVAFPIVMLGRIEGGFPEFVYGVPVAARALLVLPSITGAMTLAAMIALAMEVRDDHQHRPRLGDFLVVSSLLSFCAFAWHWSLVPAVVRW